MVTLIVKAIALLSLPLVVFVLGGELMLRLSDPGQLRDKVQKEKNLDGLGLRLQGYKFEVIEKYWDALKAEPGALDAERRMLEIDLVFPLVYGAGFAAALMLAWAALGRPFHPVWILTPLFVEVVADWIENLIQLGQVRLFAGSDGVLQPGWIQVASIATSVKVALFCVSYLLVLGLVVLMIYRNWPRSMAR
jgi:hypothetical protein